MNCPNCEAILTDENINFCEFCGYELNLNREDKNKSLTKEKVKKVSRRRCC